MSGEDPRRSEGPTELVEGADGELVERLSGGTATVLLAWLIGIGALSTLLAAWLFVWIVSRERLGLGALFGGFGFYTGLAGATGPCILWLAGRAQDRPLRWFLWTATRIALVMVAVVVALVAGAIVLMAGTLPGIGVALAGLLMAGFAVAVAQVWALATWAADRWIARARTEP